MENSRQSAAAFYRSGYINRVTSIAYLLWRHNVSSQLGLRDVIMAINLTTQYDL